MKKIRLEIEDIRVTSFDTAADRPAGAGTVRGRAATEPIVECGTYQATDCVPTGYTDCLGQCGVSGAFGCQEPSAGYCSDDCTNPYGRDCYTQAEHGCQTFENTCECNTAIGC